MIENLDLIEKKDGYTLYKIINHIKPGDPDFGWGNGYVAVSKDHPLYGVYYQDLPEEIQYDSVHGGITYSNHQGDEWMFGFDTMHSGDNLKDHDEDYVISQVYVLYEALSKVTKV